MKIEGSIALVTGANRGLGQAIVAALIEAGAAKVYAAARDEKKVAAGPRVVPLTLDTTKPEQVAAAAALAPDVTLLINNAGVLNSFNLLTASPEEIDADFRTNVLGTLGVVKAFVPALERAPEGAAVVNVLSIAAHATIPSMGGYCASKAASYSMTLALRPQLRAKRIDVLAALPGPIDTDMIRNVQMPKFAPADVAREILAGIERGDEEIYPDPMAQQMGALWSKSPKEFERAFSAF